MMYLSFLFKLAILYAFGTAALVIAAQLQKPSQYTLAAPGSFERVPIGYYDELRVEINGIRAVIGGGFNVVDIPGLFPDEWGDRAIATAHQVHIVFLDEVYNLSLFVGVHDAPRQTHFACYNVNGEWMTADDAFIEASDEFAIQYMVGTHERVHPYTGRLGKIEFCLFDGGIGLTFFDLFAIDPWVRRVDPRPIDAPIVAR